jgi:hypothetical protein
MKPNRTWLALLIAAVGLCLAGTCVVVEEGPEYEDVPYGEESAEMQTEDEQMEQVEEQIER